MNKVQPPPFKKPHSRVGSQRERQNPMRQQPWPEPIPQTRITNRHGPALSGLGSPTILEHPLLRHIIQMM